MTSIDKKDQNSPSTSDDGNVRPGVPDMPGIMTKAEVRHELERQAELPIRDCSEIREVHELLSRKGQVIISVAVVVMYPVWWIIYGVFREPLWRASVNSSIALSQYGGFLNVYSWIFSNVFFKWYIALMAILLLIAPRKDSTMKSITVFMISYTIRQYLRLFIQEDRPQYVSQEIVLRAGCDCAFGMPSGHSEGSTMLYSLLFFELIIQTKHFSKLTKYLFTGLAFYIILSIMFARVYYGRHSIPQVILGSWQGMFFFALMVLFEAPLNLFFRKFLNRGRKQFFILLAVGSFIIIANLLFWFLYFDRAIQDASHGKTICVSCFEKNALKMRIPLAQSLVLPSMYLGIVIGYHFGMPTFLEYNEHMLRLHFTWKGLARVVVMTLMHWPMLIFLGLHSDPNWTVPIGTLIYILTGFLITFVDLLINQKLKIDFRGDVKIFRCIKVGVASGQAEYQEPRNNQPSDQPNPGQVEAKNAGVNSKPEGSIKNHEYKDQYNSNEMITPDQMPRREEASPQEIKYDV